MGNQVSVPPKGSSSAQPAPNPIMSFVPMIVVVAILYLMIIRPQQKQAKEHRRLVDNLKAGDRVVTQGGIHGVVTALKPGIVQLKIADNVRIDVDRSAVSQVVQDPANGVVSASGEKSS